jgi:hypothetical protein
MRITPANIIALVLLLLMGALLLIGPPARASIYGPHGNVTYAHGYSWTYEGSGYPVKAGWHHWPPYHEYGWWQYTCHCRASGVQG